MGKAVVFDVGNVLYDWNPRFLYERLIPPGPALDAFLRDVAKLNEAPRHFRRVLGVTPGEFAEARRAAG